METGTTDIDAVSGSTVTSRAFVQAADDALAEARGAGEAVVKMAPGTYTASAYGFIQIEPLSVSVTVDEHEILDIVVDGNRDSVAMVRSVKTYMIPRMLELQSVAVDSISGATATSSAVKLAVEDALAQALEAGGSEKSAISAFQTPETKEAKKEEIDVEVLVVGLGGAG